MKIPTSLSVDEAVSLGREKIQAAIRTTARGCWEWQGSLGPHGYGQTSWYGKPWRVHRLVYRLWNGEFPQNLDVCHACDNKRCCNPGHLWLGGQQANSLDIVYKGNHYKAARAHCPRGHAYAEHGVIHSTKKTWRICKICARGRWRVRAGWPEDLAYSLPLQKNGHNPNGIGKKWDSLKSPTGREKKKFCKRGHPLFGENLYLTPDKRRQCRICHAMHVVASAKRTTPSASEVQK